MRETLLYDIADNRYIRKTYAEVSDFNEITQNGFFRATERALNGPLTNTVGCLIIHLYWNKDTQAQFCVFPALERWFLRFKRSDLVTWGQWKEIPFKADIPTDIPDKDTIEGYIKSYLDTNGYKLSEA